MRGGRGVQSVGMREVQCCSISELQRVEGSASVGQGVWEAVCGVWLRCSHQRAAVGPPAHCKYEHERMAGEHFVPSVQCRIGC